MNLEIALSLARKGKKVIVSSRRGAIRGIMELGDDNSSPQQQRLSVLLSDFMRSGQVKIHFGKAISEITATGAGYFQRASGQGPGDSSGGRCHAETAL